MNETIESKKVEYPTGDYYKAWDKVQPEQVLPGQYLYGSRLRSKMIEFLKQTYFDKEALIYYMGLGPVRNEENEVYEDYKVRQRFQRALVKYRTQVRQAVFINAVEKIQIKLKAEKEATDGQPTTTVNAEA